MTFKLSIPSNRFNYFKTIKAVLGASLKGIAEERKTSVERLKEQMTKHLECFSREYRTRKKPLNDYPDPLCRLAYVYCYVGVNANLCETAIRGSEELSEFILDKLKQNGEIKVCAFGGGPGTELLAISKFLVSKRGAFEKSTVTFAVLDEVEEWAETWELIEAEVKSYFRGVFGKPSEWPFMTSRAFIPFDITETKNYGSIKSLFEHDLYILSYVISEIYDEEEIEGLRKLLQIMATSARRGSMFLVIDRNESSLFAKAKSLLQSAGLEIVNECDSQRNMDGDEQVSDLEEYRMDRLPRITWNAFWVVGRKQ